MADYEAQCTIYPVTNVAEDASTNVWSFVAVDSDELADIAIALGEFYDDMYLWYPETVRQNNHLIKIYDRADPVPRAPQYQTTFNLTGAPSGIPLPPEVALCLSFQAVPISGTPQARRRGRTYFGPNLSGANATPGIPSTSLINALATAGEALKAASDAALNWSWGVWSTVDEQTSIIHEGWVDNAWDTQRRRGVDSTARTIWP
uniref:Uncharacterized protein n=1 Tax=uncultured prokaryote TaxID=198431 RepID=A0A0H5QQ43_9ZZZZ|nr:hypothetical protein [uncultured prokaryote]